MVHADKSCCNVCYSGTYRTYIRVSQQQFSLYREKKSRPTVKDLRPIALTDTTYKLLMGIVRNKIQNHLKENDNLMEEQAAYTENRRTSDNLFILHYCVQKSYENKKPLFIISIDFQKAFDSISRAMLIKVMMKYKIHPKLIDLIAEIYTNDKTKMFINNKEICEIEITNGIRQGCNGSTTIFLM